MSEMLQKYLDRFLVTVGTLFLTACGGFIGNPDAEMPERLALKSVANQAFVEGGEYEIGDVGKIDNGAPYVTRNREFNQ